VIAAEVHIGTPSNKAVRRALSDAEQLAYAVSGALAHGRLVALVASAEFKAMTKDDRADAIQDAVKGSRKDALGQLFGWRSTSLSAAGNTANPPPPPEYLLALPSPPGYPAVP